MKRFLKGLGLFCLGCLTLILIVVLLRVYNDYRYALDPTAYSSQTGGIESGSYPLEFEGVKVEPLDKGSLQGFHFLPQDKKHRGLVVCYGGSEGSPNYLQASRLAQEGYECLALHFFGVKNLPPSLVNVPLDQFDEVLAYLHELEKDGEPLTVLGASKGAEFALNLASRYQEIDKLVLIAPSSHNFEGLDFEHPGSSWTWKGKELPYIDLKEGSLSAFLLNIVLPAITKAPISYAATYESALLSDEKSDEKRIPASQIAAKILLIAGDDDRVWNSLEMAQDIQLQKPDSLLYIGKGAGHLFAGPGFVNFGGMRLETGGTEEANKRADLEAQQRIYEFLSSEAY